MVLDVPLHLYPCTLFCPRIPGYLTPPVEHCAHIENFVSLPYTLCDITSRSRPVLTIQRALLFLVDREAVPLMTPHLSVPSSARESAPRGRQWCRIHVSSRGPPRVYGSGCCWPIAAPRSPEGEMKWFIVRTDRYDDATRGVAGGGHETENKNTHSCNFAS
jgi:hypothetical protein